MNYYNENDERAAVSFQRSRMSNDCNKVVPEPFAEARGSAICCQKCGERIRRTPYRWGSYQWLCGLCLDGLQNEDKRSPAQSPNVPVSDGANHK